MYVCIHICVLIHFILDCELYTYVHVDIYIYTYIYIYVCVF